MPVQRLESFSHTAPDHIFFAADNEVTLYINGIQYLQVNDWHQTAYQRLHVQNGDVIALKVRDFGVWYGVIAQLVIDGREIVTGRDDWLSMKAPASHHSLDWTKKDYPLSKICTWNHPVLRPNPYRIVPGKSRYFPAPTAARYVWDRYAGEGNTIYLRYRIGGESHNCITYRKVLFAGDNSAKLYVNGVLKDQISDWVKYKSTAVTLKLGDVVSLVVSDYGVWYGAIAAIQTYSNYYYSTGKDDWRATKSFALPGTADAWMLPEYSACRWSKPVLRDAGKIVPGKAPHFPYSETGAEYVWAADAGVHDTIFLRTVIGGGC